MVLFSLTIVRHGETSYNRKGIIQGQTNVPLSNTGHEQARLVAERLQNDRYSHIISSDLSRAHETAEAIVTRNTASSSPIRLDERLRERKFGEYEGRPSQELMEAAKSMSLPSWTEFNPSGSETFQQVHERAVTFFYDLCEEMMNQNTATTQNGKRRLSESNSTSSLSQTERIRKSEKIVSPEPFHESQDRKTEIGDIILPNVIELDNLDEVTNSSNTNKRVQDDSEFILFQNDSICKTSVESNNPKKSEEHVSEESTCDTKQNVCTHTSTENSSHVTDFVDDSDNFDEWQTIGDVLVVSHGGLIKELVKFFVEKLDCEMPDGFRKALRICHNCSVSKFLVSVENVDRSAPKVTCLYFNSKEHLQGLGVEFAEGKY